MIQWTDQAQSQLEQAYDYIALTGNEEVAEQLTVRILATIEQLASFPLSGRVGRVEGTRELVVANTPFIAAYTIEKSRIVILAIYHGARRWPEEF